MCGRFFSKVLNMEYEQMAKVLSREACSHSTEVINCFIWYTARLCDFSLDLSSSLRCSGVASEWSSTALPEPLLHHMASQSMLNTVLYAHTALTSSFPSSVHTEKECEEEPLSTGSHLTSSCMQQHTQVH